MLAGSAVFADGGVSATFIPGADDLDPNLYHNDLIGLNLAPGGTGGCPRRWTSRSSTPSAARRSPKSPSRHHFPSSGTAISTSARQLCIFRSHPSRPGEVERTNDGFINGNFSITDPADPNFGWTERGYRRCCSETLRVVGGNPNVFAVSRRPSPSPPAPPHCSSSSTRTSYRTGLCPRPTPSRRPSSIRPLAIRWSARASGLTLTDAFFNVQTYGQTFFGPQTTEVGSSTSGQTATTGSPKIVTVNLPRLTTSSPATPRPTYARGFGPASSSCGFTNVQFFVQEGLLTPVANYQQNSTPQGQSLVRSGGRRPGQRQAATRRTIRFPPACQRPGGRDPAAQSRRLLHLHAQPGFRARFPGQLRLPRPATASSSVSRPR